MPNSLTRHHDILMLDKIVFLTELAILQKVPYFRMSITEFNASTKLSTSASVL